MDRSDLFTSLLHFSSGESKLENTKYGTWTRRKSKLIKIRWMNFKRQFYVSVLCTQNVKILTEPPDDPSRWRESNPWIKWKAVKINDKLIFNQLKAIFHSFLLGKLKLCSMKWMTCTRHTSRIQIPCSAALQPKTR